MAAEDSLVPRAKETPGQTDFQFAREFLDVQRKEIELKGQDILLRKQELSQGHEYAQQSLSAMGADRVSQRTHRLAAMRQYLIFSGAVLFLLLVFAGLALHWNREAVVLEGLKIIGTFLGGLGAGAFFGYRKGQKDGSKPSSGSEDEES